jgi:phosphoserine phosphatase
MTVLHVFDMDGTLLPGTTACTEIARATSSTADLRRMEDEFATGGDTFAFARRLVELWPGLTAEDVRAAFEQAPKLDGIDAVFEDIRRRGEHAIVITLAPDFFANHFASAGVRVHASGFPPLPFRAALDETAVLTVEDKPRLARAACHDLAIDPDRVVAYGDSMSDVALFREARWSVAVNPDPRLVPFSRAAFTGNDLRDAYRLARELIGADDHERSEPRDVVS